MADKDYVFCDCGNRLGERIPGGLIAQRHKGRRILGLVLTSCESCHRWTAPPEVVEALTRLVGPFELPEAA